MTLDAAAKKHLLRLVPYALYLAGTRRRDGRQSVSLVSWFTQTSFDPPLVALGLHRESEAYGAVHETGVMALNMLSSSQKEVLNGFYKHVEVADGKAGVLETAPGPETGCPTLPALLGTLELKMVGSVAVGEHATVVFQVVGAATHDPAAAVLEHKTAGLHYAG